MNRYEQPGVGRFMSPDPYKASAGPSDPGSWNRYAYVGGDPVTYSDLTGLQRDAGGDDEPSPYAGDFFGFALSPFGFPGVAPSVVFQIAAKETEQARARAA